MVSGLRFMVVTLNAGSWQRFTTWPDAEPARGPRDGIPTAIDFRKSPHKAWIGDNHACACDYRKCTAADHDTHTPKHTYLHDETDLLNLTVLLLRKQTRYTQVRFRHHHFELKIWRMFELRRVYTQSKSTIAPRQATKQHAYNTTQALDKSTHLPDQVMD